ncbi:hypothetical protein [Cystobacter fuscus]|uniref:hypothetical protein n=1 Tax=Cystobacter fuscus TaxID=43 RepID=UPI002B2D6F0B|nr:hypothetical protein F0U63_33485 [Cystobacter fuscus]
MSPYAVPLFLISLLSGCAASRTVTFVEGTLEPRNLRFVTVVEQRGDEPGGWRAACLRMPIKSDTGEGIICKMGVDMPIRTEADGLISLSAAQRIAADCGNVAAQIAFTPTTAETPLGILCESFKTSFDLTLKAAVAGSRVKTACHPRAEIATSGR